MACQILAFFTNDFAQPLLNMRIIDIIVVAPLLIASVVRRIDVDALHPTLILRQQSFQGFQIIAVDNHVITAVVLGMLAHFVKAILTLQHTERHFLMMIDNFAFSDPFQSRHGVFSVSL